MKLNRREFVERVAKFSVLAGIPAVFWKGLGSKPVERIFLSVEERNLYLATFQWKGENWSVRSAQAYLNGYGILGRVQAIECFGNPGAGYVVAIENNDGKNQERGCPATQNIRSKFCMSSATTRGGFGYVKAYGTVEIVPAGYLPTLSILGPGPTEKVPTLASKEFWWGGDRPTIV